MEKTNEQHDQQTFITEINVTGPNTKIINRYDFLWRGFFHFIYNMVRFILSNNEIIL